MAKTLLQLRTEVQVLYDIAGSAVLDADEWNVLVQGGYDALWARVVQKMPSFRVTPVSFSLTTTQTRALPVDFRDVFKVLLNPGTAQERILDRYPLRVSHAMADRSYRIEGSSLVIEPLARCAGNYELVYVPTCPELVDDTDELDAELNQFERAVVWHAVIEAQSREETDAGQFAALLAAKYAEVDAWAAGQRSADPDQVEDVRRSNFYGPAGWYR